MTTLERLPPVRQQPALQTYSTRTVAEKDRLAFWLDMICSMYVKLECDEPEQGAALFGDIEFKRLGAIDLTRLHSNASKVRRTPGMIKQDSDCYCLIHLQLSGRSVVCQDGRMAVMNAGDYVMYDSTRPYELLFDHHSHEVLVLRLLRSSLDNHVSNLQELTATTISSNDATSHLLSSMLGPLSQPASALHPASEQGVSDAITSVIAAALRGLPGANVQKTSSLHAYHVARIKAYVCAHLRDPGLSIQAIASGVALSADHVSRLFKSEAMALSRWIWWMRLEACKRDVTDARQSGRSLSDIAFSWGFNDAAHFSRRFREEYGQSPRQWRELH